MEIKKFTKGAKFLKPVLEGHNEVVDALELKVGRVSGADGINVIKTSKDLSISATHGWTHFRFGIVQKAFRRAGDAIVQLCEYSGNEWHRTKDIRQVDTQFLTGYYFVGMPVKLLELPETKILQVMSEGTSYARFWLEEDLIEDSSVTCEPVDYPNHKADSEIPEGTNETDIWGAWGGTILDRDESNEPIPKKLGCFWNDALLRWEAGLEKCP